jgi:hypothetical protein
VIAPERSAESLVEALTEHALAHPRHIEETP